MKPIFQRLSLIVIVVVVVAGAWCMTVERAYNQILGVYSFTSFLSDVAVSYLGLGVLFAFWSKRGRRRRLFLGVTVTLSWMVALLLVEASVLFSFVDFRVVFDTPYTKAWENPRNRLDPELLHIHRPHDSFTGSIPGDLVGWLGIETNRRYDVDVRYDANGFRNAVDLDHADVVVIGDSFVEGPIVPYESIASTRLAGLLGTTVLNLGQTGYGPQQVAAVFRRFALPADPKTVVWIVFEGNDLTCDFRRYAQVSRDPKGFVTQYHSLWTRSFVRNAVLAFDRTVHQPQEQGIEKSMTRSGTLTIPGELQGQRVYFGFESAPLITEDLRSIVGAQEYIRSVAETCHDRGITFILAFAPIKYRVLHDLIETSPESRIASWSVTTMESRVEEWAHRQGIHFIDLTPALRDAAKRGAMGYFLDDGHWNSTGHGVAATEIAHDIRSGER